MNKKKEKKNQYYLFIYFFNELRKFIIHNLIFLRIVLIIDGQILLNTKIFVILIYLLYIIYYMKTYWYSKLNKLIYTSIN